ncbi:hypothetical protein PanWU01x14_121280 [Parasponia andersonii]|uniref:Uncharacterized protein n=1 Tax=Parasponia andersonii TaxID=3476 RepID=A0A2P5CVE2_PARAD|nr:hypothetical protein PanWU01x14_121280 [Parasponia andersonii]
MEETLVNLQQVTNQINDTLRRLAEGQMMTPPQHERPKERPAQLPEKGIQILETRRRGQPRTQQERHEEHISKGKGKPGSLERRTRMTIEKCLRKNQQGVETRSCRPKIVSGATTWSQKTLPDQPAVKQDNKQRSLFPPARNDAFPLNVDVHNLRIALDALAGWDDELADGYRQSPFSEEVRAAALPTR